MPFNKCITSGIEDITMHRNIKGESMKKAGLELLLEGSSQGHVCRPWVCPHFRRRASLCFLYEILPLTYQGQLMLSKLIPYSRFLNLSAIDILDRVILCGNSLVYLECASASLVYSHETSWQPAPFPHHDNPKCLQTFLIILQGIKFLRIYIVDVIQTCFVGTFLYFC